MSNILLTYEFGGGLGHLSRLIEVAKRLGSEHKLFFAIPDNPQARAVLDQAHLHSKHLVKAVGWHPMPGAASKPTNTLADVLALFEYGDLVRLQSACLQWLDLIRTVSPELIIADFSPTLRLVSQGQIPTVVVGNGYTVPPGRRLLPPFVLGKA